MPSTPQPLSIRDRIPSDHPIVVFDGVCVFCNGSVNFIIARDPEAVFRFTPLQGELGTLLTTRCGGPQATTNPQNDEALDLDTIVLWKADRCFVRTDALLEIVRDLPGAWRMLYVLRIIPRGLRDALYRVVAKNRYRLFGRHDACMIPGPGVRSRFLET